MYVIRSSTVVRTVWMESGGTRASIWARYAALHGSTPAGCRCQVQRRHGRLLELSFSSRGLSSAMRADDRVTGSMVGGGYVGGAGLFGPFTKIF